jgi:putative acetyltransferase
MAYGRGVDGVSLQIKVDDLSDPRIAALLQEHLDDMHRTSPPESVHALDLSGLKQPEITFWSVWDGAELVGCGALKRLDAEHAELKSMRTPNAHRRKGIGKVILEHILKEARQRGFRRMSLETGSMEFFEPARTLYARYGFVRCGPFGDYWDDPHSAFMTREL